MFTTGIFTTHLPYLAFVFMYMVLLMCGNEKIPVSIPVEEQETINFSPSSQNCYFIKQFNDEQRRGEYHPPSKLNPILVITAPKEKQAKFLSISLIQELAFYFIFSRPPPLYSAIFR
jgi:hypothetical protein